jgi:hypothetical protein
VYARRSLAALPGSHVLLHQPPELIRADCIAAGDLGLRRPDLIRRARRGQQAQGSSGVSRSDADMITASGRPLRVVTTRSWVSRTASSTADRRACASANGIVVMT